MADDFSYLIKPGNYYKFGINPYCYKKYLNLIYLLNLNDILNRFYAIFNKY